MTPATFLPHFSYFEKLTYRIKPMRIPLAIEYDVLTKAIDKMMPNSDQSVEPIAESIWRMTGGSNMLVAKALSFIARTIQHVDTMLTDLQDEGVELNNLSTQEIRQVIFPETNSKIFFSEIDDLNISTKMHEILPSEFVKRMMPTEFWPSGDQGTQIKYSTKVCIENKHAYFYFILCIASVSGRRASLRQAKFLENASINNNTNSSIGFVLPKSPMAARKMLFGTANLELNSLVGKINIYDKNELDADRPPDADLVHSIFLFIYSNIFF
jgi:hypothetical protein